MIQTAMQEEPARPPSCMKSAKAKGKAKAKPKSKAKKEQAEGEHGTPKAKRIRGKTTPTPPKTTPIPKTKTTRTPKAKTTPKEDTHTGQKSDYWKPPTDAERRRYRETGLGCSKDRWTGCCSTCKALREELAAA